MMQSVFRLFWPCRLLHHDNLPSGEPAVFVANHIGSYAPVAVLAAFPVRLYPWVAREVADRRLCPPFLRKDFIEPELRLRPPLSRAAAWLIAKPCVGLMHAIGAIPVAPRSMRITATWKRTLELLLNGKQIIIFPENENRSAAGSINDFDDGFIGLGAVLYRKTGRRLSFVPLSVSRSERNIGIGAPILFDPCRPFREEKARIIKALRDHIAGDGSSQVRKTTS
jgi:hypothetical protein